LEGGRLWKEFKGVNGKSGGGEEGKGRGE